MTNLEQMKEHWNAIFVIITINSIENNLDSSLNQRQGVKSMLFKQYMPAKKALFCN